MKLRKTLEKLFENLAYHCNVANYGAAPHVFILIWSVVSIFEGVCLDCIFDDSGYQEQFFLWLVSSFFTTGLFSMLCLVALFDYLGKLISKQQTQNQ